MPKSQPPAIPYRLGELFDWQGKLAQSRGDSFPDPTKPIKRYHIAIADRLSADEYRDILGQVPWSPPGSGTWSGECRYRNGGRCYVDASTFRTDHVDYEIPAPSRGGRDWQWQWSEFFREWKKHWK